MAYRERLSNRIREALARLPNVEEKSMKGGLTFMINDKTCIGIIGEEMMRRIDPSLQETALEKTGCRIMDFTGRPMKGYLKVDNRGIRNKKESDYWINLCLDFNKLEKSSRKKNRKK